MKPVLFIICVLLLPLASAAQSGDSSADAPEISDYAWGFPIEVRETASFYSVELPLEVNRSVTDPALRDVGVYNSEGNPLSRMFERAGEDQEQLERSNPLPALPLYEADSRADEDRLTLQREGSTTQFSFDLEDLLAPDEGEVLVAYIVDMRQSDESASAIDLAWDQMKPGFMGRVIVEGGDDLQNWRQIGSAVVAYLREDSASIEQRRIALRRGDFDFLRIRWEGLPDDWFLSQVMGVYVDGSADTSRKFITLESAGVDPDDGGRIFSLGGAPIVDQLRVVLPDPNTVISARVMYWSERRDRWLEAGHGSYHHIIRNDNAVMSDPININKARTSQFKVIVTRGPTNANVQLEVGWRPDKLLFLAQGEPPFTLAAGNADDELRQFPQQRIYGARSLADLAEKNGGVVEASLGQRYAIGGPARLVATTQINWQTVLLWLGLILGVVFVGFMAMKTIRELRSQ
jgi:hypothetical protein